MKTSSRSVEYTFSRSENDEHYVKRILVWEWAENLVEPRAPGQINARMVEIDRVPEIWRVGVIGGLFFLYSLRENSVDQ